MLVKEKFRVKGSLQDVWQFMLDPERIGSCVPGCEKIETLGEGSYQSTIRIKLPIFSITATSTTTITETDPPHHLKSITDGKYDLGGGTFHQEMVLDMEEIDGGEVEVSYSAETTLEGGLSGFSEDLMGTMAHGVAEQFAKNIQTKIEGREEG
jgi:carbon monoxide dehydrogenase subunit G